jgi:hypothetical protein
MTAGAAVENFSIYTPSVDVCLGSILLTKNHRPLQP